MSFRASVPFSTTLLALRGLVRSSTMRSGEFVDVPEIDLDGVGEDLGDPGLPRDDDGHAIHGLERGDAEGLAHRGHDEDVAHGEELVALVGAEEAGEVEIILQAQARGLLDHAGEQVAGAGHDEAHVLGGLEHAGGGLEEVLRGPSGW